MARTIQIVDSIQAAPALRLDLNDSVSWFLRQGADFSPPNLKRSVVSSLLADGGEIPASAYENRTLRIPLTVRAATADLLAAELQKLHRELDRKTNIIKYQHGGQAAPVFFRTFRSPDYKLSKADRAPHAAQVDLEVLAEPFAYGLRVTQAAATINNDPAHATNPMRLDVVGVTGDVPTPLFLRLESIDGTYFSPYLAIRRHGTFANIALVKQAETFTAGTDTAVQANDAVMSGAGNNFMRTTFATVATQSERLKTDVPFGAAANSGEYRGVYRVLALIRGSVSASVFDINFSTRINLTSSDLFVSEKVRVTTTNASSRGYVDLGLLSIPTGGDPGAEGLSNIDLPVLQPTLAIYASRVSGTGGIDWDYIVFLPADEEMCILTAQVIVGQDWILDGPKDMVYAETGSAVAIGVRGFPRVGSIPLLTPNQTNRLMLLAPQMLGLDDTYSNVVTHTLTAVVSFWPRFLYIRP